MERWLTGWSSETPLADSLLLALGSDPWIWVVAVAVLAGTALAALDVTRLNRKLHREVAERQRAEQELRKSEAALRALHGIMTAPGTDFAAKLNDLLEMGCERFRLSDGLIARHEGDSYEIMAAVGAAAAPDTALALTDASCEQALTQDAPHAVRDASGRTSFCMRLVIEGQLYGILHFSGRGRPADFSPTDGEILKHMAQWLEGEIQRRRAESEMRKLSSALQNIADSVAITDQHGVIRYVNPAFTAMTGYAKDEVLGRTHRILKSGVHDEGFYEQMWGTIRAAKPFRAQFVNRRKDGALYYEEKTITPLTDWHGEVRSFVSTSHDITERIQTEEQLRQHHAELAHAGRLTLMSEMASGFAHELNQPLTAIVNYAQGSMHRLRSGRGDTEALITALQEITRQGQRAGEIIRRIRRFIRKDQQHQASTQLNELVREALNMAAADMRRAGIRVVLNLDDDLPPVVADTIQIEQVILNLIRNAIDAMQQEEAAERVLTIRTSLGPDGQVEVAIHNTGSAVPEENRELIFQPFFTTKPTGLGLGLSISRSIIEAHAGHLWMIPEASGSTFRFFLPIAGDPKDEP
ncbi:PAS domain S-box protein [Ectothiorhodospiraceae bacterium 2226]|nr:PAS domain S-box protein [Ectothiorhodospiraceae bacterium 2226]